MMPFAETILSKTKKYLNAPLDKSGDTALHIADLNDNLGLIEWLVNKGAEDK